MNLTQMQLLLELEVDDEVVVVLLQGRSMMFLSSNNYLSAARDPPGQPRFGQWL